MGLINDAISCFQKMIEIDSSKLIGYQNLALIYEQVDYKYWQSLNKQLDMVKMSTSISENYHPNEESE